MTMQSEAIEGEVCIANISKRERERRLFFGAIAFAGALLLLTFLIMGDFKLWWRLALFIPFAVAATGFFQWRDQTCVKLAREGVRKLGEGVEQLVDQAELAQVRKQARWVQIKSVISGVVLTALTFLLP
jgi:hypothetical protein